MGPPLFSTSKTRPGEIERALARRFGALLGVDEAGRGALCGPVVAAAVAIDPALHLPHLNDSKKLSPQAREALAPEIRESARTWGLGIASAQEVDQCNVLQATFLAMKRAVAAATAGGFTPDLVLVDGPHAIPDFVLPQKPIVKGDARSLAIAAASILAKTHRDDLMRALHQRYPAYGFDRHKGYGTRDHRQAMVVHGLCPEHRKTFWHDKKD
jgi:ribonuclease HII